MKIVLVGIATVFVALNGFAQGQAWFNNNVPGVVVTHVYEPLASDPWFSQIGNGTNDYLPGTTDWSAFTLIGMMPSGQYGANNTMAQLLGAPGLGIPEDALLPASPITSFRSGATAGHVVPVVCTFSGIPPEASPATLQMVAWDNTSGMYPTWAEANQAWMAGLIAAGKSLPINVSALGGDVIPPVPPAYLTGLLSFNLYVIPEPSMFVLVGLGAAALMIARRRKC